MAAIQKGQYFLKDKKAIIYKYFKGEKDSSGFYKNDYYVPLTPAALWCYIKQYDTLYYPAKNLWYEVSRVDTTDDYNGELFVYVKNLKTGIKEEKIKPYGYEPETE